MCSSNASKFVGQRFDDKLSQLPKTGTDVAPNGDAVDGERVFGAALWHSKPDFVSLLTQRFNDLPEEDEMGGDNAAAAYAETSPK